MTDITQADRDAAAALAIGGKYTCFDCVDELARTLAVHRETIIRQEREACAAIADECARSSFSEAHRLVAERRDGTIPAAQGTAAASVAIVIRSRGRVPTSIKDTQP